jgi:hypothetical protein
MYAAMEDPGPRCLISCGSSPATSAPMSPTPPANDREPSWWRPHSATLSGAGERTRHPLRRRHRARRLHLAGRAEVGRKATWPTWHPTREMMVRQPETRDSPTHARRADEPVGARALHLQGGRDTSTGCTVPARSGASK